MPCACALRPGADLVCLYADTFWYYDGCGVNNPIGAFHNNHNLGLCYASVVNLSPAHRFTLPHIFLVTVALSEEYSHWPAYNLIHGVVTNSESSSSSYGRTVNRMHDGQALISVPDERSPTRFSSVNLCGSCVGLSGDTPALAWALGMKESYGPQVHSICRLCNCCQTGHAGSLFPARTPNSFLPWTGAGKQVWQLRTVDETDSLRVRVQGKNAAETKAILDAAGMNTLDHGCLAL